MAAYQTTASVARSASSLAGPVLPKRRSRNMISVAPSPSMLPSPSMAFPPNHRPNRAELEACLAGAHVRAHSRHLREALGRGKPPSATAPRTTRAVASSFKSSGAPTLPTTTTTALPSAAASPLFRVAYPEAGKPSAFQSAPSPSMLPPPPATPRPLFPRRRSRAPVQGPVVGLGLSFGANVPLGFLEADAPLTPHHVYPDTFRRTPGAPLQAKPQETVDGASYFHLPADIITPAPGRAGQGTIGLGILNVDLQYFPSSL
ncbi:hypothetical protein OH77DRAFT_877479 [Trametes cingulata]|nr:hypothetical protein OH77DRAFT_877479 [Trametes cingulata]